MFLSYLLNNQKIYASNKVKYKRRRKLSVCFVSIEALENWIHTQLFMQSAFNSSFLYVTQQIILFWQLQSCSCLLKGEPLLSKQRLKVSVTALILNKKHSKMPAVAFKGYPWDKWLISQNDMNQPVYTSYVKTAWYEFKVLLWNISLSFGTTITICYILK